MSTYTKFCFAIVMSYAMVQDYRIYQTHFLLKK